MLEMIFHIKYENDQRAELDVIRSVLHAQYQQYRSSQENIALVNQKYHDMKNLLVALRAQENNKQRLAYLFLLPLFGSLSDCCRSKMGKRRPFILGGSIAPVSCFAEPRDSLLEILCDSCPICITDPNHIL